MRTIDIDMSGRVWVYTPETHKTEHHDKQRRIHLGPIAQETLNPPSTQYPIASTGPGEASVRCHLLKAIERHAVRIK
jgi:hypothetical protein